MTDAVAPAHVRAEPRRGLVIAAFAAIYIIWGSTYLGIRFAIASIPPLFMTGARFTIAGAVLYAWARVRGVAAPTRGQWRAAVIAGTMLIVGGTAAVGWAEQWLASGYASLLGASDPFWMLIGERIGPDKSAITRPRAAGVILGFVGLTILLSGDIDAAPVNAGQQMIGSVVLLLSALVWSVGSIYARHSPLPLDTAMGTGMQMFAGGIASLVLSAAVGEWARLDFAAITTSSVVAFVYLLLVGSLIGFTAYVWLLRVSTPTKVATHAFVNPVVAVMLGWWIGGESVTARMLFASAIIIVAVALVTTAPRTSGAAEGLQRVD